MLPGQTPLGPTLLGQTSSYDRQKFSSNPNRLHHLGGAHETQWIENQDAHEAQWTGN